MSFGPALAAIHFSVAVAPAYDDVNGQGGICRRGTEVVIKEEMEETRMQRGWLYVIWQTVTVAAR